MFKLLRYRIEVLEAKADLNWHVLDLFVNRSKGKLKRNLLIGMDNTRRRLNNEAEVLMNNLQGKLTQCAKQNYAIRKHLKV